MHSLWRRGFTGLVLLFGLVVLAPLAYGQVSVPLEGKGSVAGNSGAFTYSVPIEVPPGRNGLTPQLSLVYNSSAGNGFLGVGWDLPIGHVMRSTKNGVNYSCNSNIEVCFVFMLAGSSAELIKRTDLCSDCYSAMIEGSFMRFRFVNFAYWEVTDKNGTRYLFGQSSNSQLTTYIPPPPYYCPPGMLCKPSIGGYDATFKWSLDTIIDTQNNSINYSYFKDQNEIYINQISYQQNIITFHREGRSDAPTMYTPNFAVTTAYRLAAIDVWANSNHVRAYKLTYNTSGSTSRSLLANVQQFDKNATVSVGGTITGGTALPASTFGWQGDGDGNFAHWSNSSTNRGAVNDYEHYFADVNGDGREDWIQVSRTSNNGWVGLATADGNFIHWSNSSTNRGAVNNHGHYFADVNGDGRADWIQVSRTTNDGWVGLATADGNFAHWSNHSAARGALVSHEHYFADVNGDGRADWIQVSRTTNDGWVGLATADGNFAHWSNHSAARGAVNNHAHYFADVNGDGRADWIQVNRAINEGCIGLATGNGSFEHWTNCSNARGAVNNHEHYFADVNGDGKADWIQVNRTTNEGCIGLGNGDGDFVHWSNCSAARGSVNNHEHYFADVNGDGRADWIQVNRAINEGCIGLAIGDGNFVHWSNCSAARGAVNNHAHYFADVNGDGRADWIQVTRTINNGWVGLPTGSFPDLLTTISNGFGSNTTVIYNPSSEFWSSTDPRWNLPFVTQNVSSITVCPNYSDSNCIGNLSSTTNYTYTGGYYNAAAREFRGFTSVKATNAINGINTETLYHQGNGTSPAPDDAADLVGYTAHQPYQITLKGAAGVIRSQKTLTYWTDVDNVAPWFTLLKQEDSKFCETASSCKESQSLYTYDDRFKDTPYTGIYGNLTKEEHKADLSQPSEYRQILHGYKPNTTPWIVGLPSYQKVYDTAAATTLKALTVNHYDGATAQAAPTVGNLTQVGSWLNQGVGTGCDGLATSGSCIYTSMTYDTYGNLLTTVDANNRTTTLCYDASNTFVQKVTNAKSHIVRTDYYGVAWNTACGAAPTAYAGSGLYGQVKSVTDPNNQQVKNDYDVFGRQTKITPPVTTPATSETTFAYNSFGAVGSQNVQTTTAGLSSWVYFDGFGRTTKQRSTGPVISNTTKFILVDTTYNNLGQVDSTTLPYFEGSLPSGSTTYHYNDALGRQTKIIGADNSKTLFCYSLWAVATVDASGHLRQETRDGHGRLAKVDEYTGTFEDTSCPTIPTTAYATTLYKYDALGNLIKVTDAAGNITTMRYDSLSRKIAMSDPDMGKCGDLETLEPSPTGFPWYPTPCWNYKYDAVGNLIEQWNARTVNQKIFFRYDEINRLFQKDYGTQKPENDPTADVRYTYDATPSGFTSQPFGRLSEVIDASGVAKFGYDSMGRITRTDKIVDTIAYTIQTGYDNAGRVKSVTYPDGDVVKYDYNNPLLSVVYKDNNSDSIFNGTDAPYVRYDGFNALGQPGTATFGNGASGNGVKTIYSYAPNNFRLTQICTVGPGSVPCGQTGAVVLQNFSYTYDYGNPGVGNITNIVDARLTAGSHTNQTQNFVYDHLDRLTSADGVDSYELITYAYNQIGNMTCNTNISACSPTNYTYPASGASSVRPHAVSTAGAASFFYDANGNMTCNAFLSSCSSSTPNLVYDYEDRLVTFSGGSTPTNFIYDGDGGRVKKVKGGVTKIYIGKLFECFAICYGSGTWNNGEKHIFAGSARIASKPVGNTGDISYFHTNHLGSTSVITDKNGNNIAEFAYLPFGDSYPADNQAAHYKYTGQERDPETSLYFYNARYYDARIGRFTQADSIVPAPTNPQSFNRYSYVINNPINLIDPSGHSFKKWLKRTADSVRKHSEGVGFILQNLPGGFVPGTVLLSTTKLGREILVAEAIIALTAIGFAPGPDPVYASLYLEAGISAPAGFSFAATPEAFAGAAVFTAAGYYLASSAGGEDDGGGNGHRGSRGGGGASEVSATPVLLPPCPGGPGVCPPGYDRAIAGAVAPGIFTIQGELATIWNSSRLFLNWLRGNQSLTRIGNPLTVSEAKQIIDNARRLGLTVEPNPTGLAGLERTGKWAGIPHFKVGNVHIPVEPGFTP